MGGYSGVKGSTLGMFLQVKVGKGACEWEGRGGDVTVLQKVPEHTHKGKMVDMMLCIPPPRAGRMSAGVSRADIHEAYLALAMVVASQGCAQSVNTHGTHTHTHN